MFAHNILAQTLRQQGVTKEQARAEVSVLFAQHGHFPKNKKLQVRLDALKEIAYA